MSMRRADRRDSNSDHELNNPRSRQQEPMTIQEIRQLWMNARANLTEVTKERDDWKQKVQNQEGITLQLLEVQQQYQTTFELYNQEKARSEGVLIQYQEADALRLQYLAQCNELQIELKNERRSKASIKGWETRRKTENELLKQQIGDMVVLLSESLKRKEESINYLYLMGDRMDRIQHLMDSVDQESKRDPVELLEKLMRVWLAVQKILAE
jgi:hypothetical protein